MLELDACLTGCGGYSGKQYYASEFPPEVVGAGHTIAHLETLNIVVATKLWAPSWRGQKVRVWCDNANACIALQTGRSRDAFLQDCVRGFSAVCKERCRTKGTAQARQAYAKSRRTLKVTLGGHIYRESEQ